jgi:IS30 family transposase
MGIARRVGVSHETIYQAIYTPGRGLCGGLHVHLHHRGRRRRCRRHVQATRRSPLGAFRPIAVRPPEAAAREEIGHFEGDLIVGAGGCWAVITLVDRATCFCLLGHVPGPHDADSVCQRLQQIFGRLPDAGARTVTWDQGREMATWSQLETACGVTVYFADPLAAARQRELQRPAPPLPPQGHRPLRSQRSRPRQPRTPHQPHATPLTWLGPRPPPLP